ARGSRKKRGLWGSGLVFRVRCASRALSRKRLLGGERDTDNLLIVADEHALVGECGMYPDYGAHPVCARRHLVRWFDHMRPADLVVALRRQLGDDEIAFLIEDEESIALWDQEGIAPALFLAGRGLERFPDAFAGVGLETPQLTVAAHAVDVTVLDE